MVDNTNFNLFSIGQSPRFVPEKTVTAAQRMAPGGFVPAHPRAHALYNRTIGCLLFVAVLPLLALLTLAVLLVQGRPIFYAGQRLGKGQVPFDILKFRTLDTAKAQALTAGQVLPRNSNIETRMGKFLRASRLDELPQLWNIVRGDMYIVGPRPVRPALAKQEQRVNPNYNIRFTVVPGLIGPTQAYLCHGTSKRFRARYNYNLCSRRVSYGHEIALFTRVGWAVLATTGKLLMKYVAPRTSAAAQATAEAWDLKLTVPGHQAVSVSAFEKMKLGLPINTVATTATLTICLDRGIRTANVVLEPLETPEGMLTHRVTPADAVANHLIGRYLMQDAVVQPRQRKTPGRDRAWRLADLRQRVSNLPGADAPQPASRRA